jgi:hypothetical protein
MVMAKVFVEDYEMTAIADGIRKASGRTDKMLPSVMAEVANGLSAGGGESQLDALIDGTITEITSNVENVRPYAFYKSSVVNVDLPKAVNVGEYGFSGCTNLVDLKIPLVTTIGNRSFYDSRLLTNIGVLHVVKLPSSTFQYCKKLLSVDFPLLTEIGSNAFNGCSELKYLILRSETLCTLVNDTFKNSAFFVGTNIDGVNPDKLKNGCFYVPRNLVEDYKVATNWSIYADHFKALEDYTVDGTITGELDETKI